MSNIFAKPLNFIAEHFRKDPSKMLIATGVAGWALSSLAQITAIILNPKYSDKQKGYLLPQEFSDALINIGLFFGMTLVAKNITAALFRTGKFAPDSVKDFLKRSNLTNNIGKVGFNLDNIAKTMSGFPKEDYYACKNLFTSVATVGSGIIASNVLTPIIRNNNAANMQKKYIDYKNNNPCPVSYSSGMKI